jgi:hypothetical protein
MVWSIIKDPRFESTLKGEEEVYHDFMVIKFNRGEVSPTQGSRRVEE